MTDPKKAGDTPELSEDPCDGWTHCGSDCCGPCPTCGKSAPGSIWDGLEDDDEKCTGGTPASPAEMAKELRDVADVIESNDPSFSGVTVLRAAADMIERIDDLRAHYFDQAQRFDADFNTQMDRASRAEADLFVERERVRQYDERYTAIEKDRNELRAERDAAIWLLTRIEATCTNKPTTIRVISADPIQTAYIMDGGTMRDLRTFLNERDSGGGQG